MNRNAVPEQLPGTKDPQAILRRAADGLRTGAVEWGRNWFITPDACRCAGGAIAWAADPADLDGDPRYLPGAMAALRLLAAYLIDTGKARCEPHGDGWMDPVEVVGVFNDAQPAAGPVIAALDAAAQHGRTLGATA